MIAASMDSYYDQITVAANYIRQQLTIDMPDLFVMTGTGLSILADDIEVLQEIDYADIPHFPVSTVQSHRGQLLIGRHKGRPVAILAGRWHYYEGYTTKELTLPIRVLKMLGARKVVFTNVAGGVNPHYEAGDIVLLKDHINMIPDHPLRGPQDDRLGVRFPDMLQTYSRRQAQLLLQIAATHDLHLWQGCYYALQGPSLETPAEYTMIRRLGADLVGMSTVPEVIVAKHAGLEVSAVSIVSNVCYPVDRLTETTIESVIATAEVAAKKLSTLLLDFIEKRA